MELAQQLSTLAERRHFLRQTGVGLGAIAMNRLCGREAQADNNTLPHFAPKAKRVIFLYRKVTFRS